MKKIFWFACVCSLAFLMACQESGRVKGDLPVIDVEAAFQTPSELLLSDLGEEVAYVPLETNDSSLVKLNSSSKMVVTDRYLFVGDNRSPLLCFDRKTGKCLRQIGSIGQGPGEYTDGSSFLVDMESERIYVRVLARSYRCYDFEGNFLNTVELPVTGHFMMEGHYFLGDKAYIYGNVPNGETTAMAYECKLPEGNLLDSVPARPEDKAPGKTKAVAPMKGFEVYGGSSFMVQYEDDTWTFGSRTSAPLWMSEGELYHKDLFCDTIFRMKGLVKEEPVAAFYMGGLGGFGRYETMEAVKGKYIIPRVLHGGERVYFTLFTGMYDIQGFISKAKSGGMRPGCGIYNLRTGELKVSGESMYFRHKDKGMPKACIYTLSTEGEWVMIYQAEELVEARENMPEETRPEWLKNLKEDDNPVVMIIK